MRNVVSLLAVVMVLFGFTTDARLPVSARTAIQRDTAASEAVLAQARKALGGEKRLASIRSIHARGQRRTRMPGLEETLEADFEFGLSPFERYVLRENVAWPSSVDISGFDGTRLIRDGWSTSADGPQLTIGRIKPDVERRVLRLRRNQAMRLALALLLPSGTAGFQYGTPMPVTSPDGDANSIEVTRPEDFAATLFLDAVTHRPLLMKHVDDSTPQSTGIASIGLEEYRTVDQVLLPHRLMFQTSRNATTQWDVKAYWFNDSGAFARLTRR